MNPLQRISHFLHHNAVKNKTVDPSAEEEKILTRIPSIERLISFGFQPSRILDIGCYLGKWTNVTKGYFPEASFTLIDAIHYPSAESLAQTHSYSYHVELLFNEITQLEWFEEKNSGDSIFRERTAYFAHTQPRLRTTTTLDNLLGTDKFDLIKIDAQGAELPIIQGGKKLFDQAEVVVLELPFCGQYNVGVADFCAHINFLDSIGFSVFDISELHYFKECLIQVDIFFVRKTSSILRQVQASIDGGSWLP
jgi:FkbM family methyltransferase